MPKPPRQYARLTRRTASIASYSTLWLGADHLLIVNSTGVTESYRRVQLHDIKGLFLIKSDRRLYWGLPWGVIAGISGAIVGNQVYNGDPLGAALVFLVLGLIGLLWNYLLGPGCRAFVVTGVQTAPLPSIVRRGKARKIFARIRPLITAAQADLKSGPPSSPPALDSVLVPPPPAPAPVSAPEPNAPPPLA